MRWRDLDSTTGVLQLDGRASNAVEKGEPVLELAVFWGGGEPTRAVWRWAGRVASWATVGEA